MAPISGKPTRREIEGEDAHEFVYRIAAPSELSDILQIESAEFPDYRLAFSSNTLKAWYKRVPGMFRVVSDQSHRTLGFSVLVDVTERLFTRIRSGELSSLLQFPPSDIMSPATSEYVHVEVLAVSSRHRESKVGTFLIRSVAAIVLPSARYLSASPITEDGVKLCEFFGFEHVADDRSQPEKPLPVYVLELNAEDVERRLRSLPDH